MSDLKSRVPYSVRHLVYLATSCLLASSITLSGLLLFMGSEVIWGQTYDNHGVFHEFGKLLMQFLYVQLPGLVFFYCSSFVMLRSGERRKWAYTMMAMVIGGITGVILSMMASITLIGIVYVPWLISLFFIVFTIMGALFVNLVSVCEKKTE